MLNNKKNELILQNEKDLFRQDHIAPAKKFYLWLTLFALAVGAYLLFANGRASFGNIFACGVCITVAMTWIADGIKTKTE
jgi:hypothetical protein